MLIREVLHDERFTGVVYYFESNGFSSISDLETFDFELLYFVPGLNDEVITEVTELCQKACLPQENTDDVENYESVIACDDENIVVDISEEDCEEEKADQLREVFADLVDKLSTIETALADAKIIDWVAEQVKVTSRDAIPDVVTIICEELQEKIASARYTTEEINIHKEILISDLYANVMMGNRRCGSAFINHCISLGKTTMWDLRDYDFDPTQVRGASEASMRTCKAAYEQFIIDVREGKYKKEEPKEIDPLTQYLEKWESLNYNLRKCAINGGRGKTLQYTAEEIGVTRERVRQISLKASRILRLPAKRVVDKLLAIHEGVFTDEDVIKFFNDEDVALGFLFVIRDGIGCRYVKFAQKYCTDEMPRDYEKILASLVDRHIGDGANFFELMEEIETAMFNEGLAQLDFYDFLSYLLSCGYKLYGDFVVKRKNSYTLLCYDAVLRYFPDGIKLESAHDCEDLIRLRQIIRDRYGNYDLPESNHAIIARLTSMLVLCDKSTYCIAENIQYSEELIEEIVSYVNDLQTSFIFYDELFKRFQGRLLMETTINNSYCLHGIIKLLYPDEFQYDRDGMTKVGATRISLDEQITNVLVKAGRAMTREEIAKACPYAVGLRLANAAWRDPGIIQWGYNAFNHINNIRATPEQIEILENTLQTITEQNRGYCNERQLLPAVKSVLPEFITENNITDGLNIFYILECYLSPKYRFSRPHIVSGQFPSELALTNINVGKYFIGSNDILSYNDFMSTAKKCYWSSSMVSFILADLESEYIRLNENEYLVKDKFIIDEAQIKEIEQAIFDSMNGEEYVALFATFASGNYPSIGYPWNEFILDSIIRNYIPSIKIIEPIMKDRRYKRGILVKANNECSTYEELVISTMIDDGFEPTPLDLFDDYLRNLGLLLNNIPQEILESAHLQIKDNIVRFSE